MPTEQQLKVRLRIAKETGEELQRSLLEQNICKLVGVEKAATVLFLDEKVVTRNLETQTETLKQSYKSAIQRSHDAFKLLCDSLQSQDDQNETTKSKYEKLRQYNESLLHIYMQKITVRDLDLPPTRWNTESSQFQDIYVEHLQRLELLINDEILSKKQFKQYSAKKLLAKADEYSVITEKPVLVTVTPQYVNKSRDGVRQTLRNDQASYLLQMEVPLPPLNDEMAEEYLKAASKKEKEQPDWYKGMSAEEKMLFNHFMKDVNSVAEVKQKITAISSRHRTLPGVPNYSRRITQIVDENGKRLSKPGIAQINQFRYRSSHIASRDISKLNLSHNQKEMLRKQFAENNIKKIIETFLEDKIKFEGNVSGIVNENGTLNKDLIEQLPILMQTLISPIVPSALKPDKQLDKDKKSAIAALAQGIDLTISVNGKQHTLNNVKFKHIIDTNHPLNKWRYVSKTEKGDETAKQIDKLLDLLRTSMFWNSSMIHSQLLEVKNNASNLPRLTSILDINQRELHLAALEEMVVTRLGGLSYGSCVSGKDRKALETIYVDAMEVYYFTTGKLLKFNDEAKNREIFVNIFADIFLTRHQEENAGQNAPGAEGIKTPEGYLPRDIVDAIKRKSYEKVLKDSDKLANNNEPEKLLEAADNLVSFRRRAFRADFAAYTVTSPSISQKAQPENERNHEENTQLNISNNYVLLKNIINHSDFNTKAKGIFATKTPAGVLEMRKYLKSLGDKPIVIDDVLKKLEEIANRRLMRNEPERRYETERLYEIIKSIGGQQQALVNHQQDLIELDRLLSNALPKVADNTNDLLLKGWHLKF